MASSQPPAEQQQGAATTAAEKPSTFQAADGSVYDVLYAPSELDVDIQSTDTVAERLDGAFSPDIVDEVREYGKPEWEKTDSTLDPIDDIETYYDYGFPLPPAAHDAYVAAAELEVQQLQNMKDQEIAPELRQQIEQRRDLVVGKTAEELRWLKHKAYYRGVRKIRAAKQALQQALDEDLAAAAAEGDSAAGAVGDGPKQQQQFKDPSKLSLLSEEEVLAAISDPSEWDTSYLTASYQQHPAVLQQLRSAFAGTFKLPYTSPEQAAQQERQWQELMQLSKAEKEQQDELEAAREAFWQKHKPYQAYTPEHAEKMKRQQQLALHRRHKQQAFWLSLGVAIGSSAVRWWFGSSNKRRQQQQRQQQRPGSRRSTRPPTPVVH